MVEKLGRPDASSDNGRRWYFIVPPVQATSTKERQKSIALVIRERRVGSVAAPKIACASVFSREREWYPAARDSEGTITYKGSVDGRAGASSDHGGLDANPYRFGSSSGVSPSCSWTVVDAREPVSGPLCRIESERVAVA